MTVVHQYGASRVSDWPPLNSPLTSVMKRVTAGEYVLAQLAARASPSDGDGASLAAAMAARTSRSMARSISRSSLASAPDSINVSHSLPIGSRFLQDSISASVR